MVGAALKNLGKVRQPITGLILLALFVGAYPVPTLAQTGRGGTPAGRVGGAVESAYTLGAGDRIQLDIFNVPEYSREYQVLVNGTLNLPLIGSVSVLGLTLEQAANLISQRYARFLRRPIATVSLVAPRPLKIAVSGEVSRPGSYTIPYNAAGGGLQQPTLTQALTLAGGITQAANLRSAQVRRVGRGGTQVINVDLRALVGGGDLSQDLTLRDGDSIFIPTSAGVNILDSQINSDASFAPAQNQPLNVVVVGEVIRPGPQVVQPDQSGSRPSVSRAIQVAGGLTQSADINRVQVNRATRSGRIQSITVNLARLLRSGDRSQDLILQQGDTIFIPTATRVNLQQASQIANTSLAPTQVQPLNVVVAGEVTRPGPQVVQPDQSGAQPSVSRALQVAGGISQSADISRVQVRRVTRNGNLQTITVDLGQLLQAGDRSQDLILQQGDTIFVPPAASINLAQSSRLARASFAPTQVQPLNVFVAGEVTRPGPYTVQPTATGALPTVSRALQVSGGLTQSANIGSIELRRVTQSGTEQIVSLDLNQVLNGGDPRQDLNLQEGDTIFVPTSRDVNVGQSLEIASSSIAADPSQPLNIAVVGEVLRPGTYTLQTTRPAPGAPGALPSFAGLPTVSQAIQLAGGISQTADVRRIEVRRTTRVGTQQILPVNFWQLLQAGDRSQDVVLQQGDTIFVPTAADVNPAEAAQIAIASISPATIRVNVVGEVARAGVIQVPPNTPLNQAVLAAGGFNNRARRSFVDLLRLNPNGTVSRRGVEVDFAKGINEETNPILRDNDVIVVRRSSLARISDTLGSVLNPVGSAFSLFNFFRILGDL